VSSIIDKAPTLDDCTTANIKLNKVGEIIEKEELHWPEYKNSDSKREYHGQVRGLILNEVIRRIDPQVGFFIFIYLILKTRLRWFVYINLSQKSLWPILRNFVQIL
jgi:hypothetical protein